MKEWREHLIGNAKKGEGSSGQKVVHQSNSPFFGLPREIRDIIDTMTFTSRVVCVDRDAVPQGVGIMLACKQSYIETIDLYYQKTSFSFASTRHVTRWLVRIPATARDKITSVNFKATHLYMVIQAAENAGSPRFSIAWPVRTLQDAAIAQVVALLAKKHIVMREGVLSATINDTFGRLLSD